MSAAVAILGLKTALPGPARPLADDPELGDEAGPLYADTPARTLSGQLDLRPEAMPRWPRLDRYGRALAHVCLAATPAPLSESSPPPGMLVTSQRSCHETNAAFDQGLIEKGPRLASPLLFPYTLPGAAAAEVAMVLKLGGPYLVWCGGPATALLSVVTAADLIEAGAASRLLVAAADVLGGHSLRDLDRPVTPAPLPWAEAAAALWLAPADDPALGPRRRLTAGVGPAGATAAEIATLCTETLAAAELEPALLAEIVTTSTDVEACAALEAALGALAPTVPLLQLPWRVGDAGAALGLLAVAAALEGTCPCLLLALDRQGSVALVLE
ncbi:MAG: hypothetical protein HY903_10985 [Deltaproteobacteria bacterium]|nr:hypothetical protein [Deltaproteobacteria bacterium]